MRHGALLGCTGVYWGVLGCGHGHGAQRRGGSGETKNGATKKGERDKEVEQKGWNKGLE